MCLADVIVVVLWLAHGTRQGLGVKGSMYWYRKEMGLRVNSDRQLIEGIPAVTIFFFILGPLPQALKALGAGRVYWAKAWAALLLGAWCFEVVIRFSARSISTDDPGESSCETRIAGLLLAEGITDGPPNCICDPILHLALGYDHAVAVGQVSKSSSCACILSSVASVSLVPFYWRSSSYVPGL